MIDPRTGAANGEAPEGTQAAEDPAAAPGAELPAAEASPDPLAALEAEKAELKDRLLRALAEMENLRRRVEKDLADARAYGVTRFARDMLDVADNLTRAVQSFPADQKTAAEGPLKTLIEGVELTERDLLKKMESHGVRKLEPEGHKFDPNFHQAMFEAADETKPNGTVIAVVQSGYVIGERVLRPAMVGVSRGGPKPAPAAEQPSKEA